VADVKQYKVPEAGKHTHTQYYLSESKTSLLAAGLSGILLANRG
jgi:hypothetical protein